MGKWVKRWKVNGSNGNVWIVAQDQEGNYGCSCPVWKFRRQECHHIKQVKMGLGVEAQKIEKPKYVLAKVLKPTYKKETNELLIPLVGIPDAMMMEATICYNLLKYGYSMREIREIRHIPDKWTAKSIINYIKTHGEAEYPEGWYER